jgi:hypothetical protein
VNPPKRQWYVGGWLLLVLLWCGACTNVREHIEKPQHSSGKTELDLEYGRPEAASRYHRPQWVHPYSYDKTEVDLGTPRASRADKEHPANNR